MYDKMSYCMISQEEKIRVNARIPKTLYDYVCSEYDNVSQAINEGLEKLRELKYSEMSYTTNNIIQESHTCPDKVIQKHTHVIHPDIQVLTVRTEEQKTRMDEYKTQVLILNTEIERLKNVIMEAPDPLELTELRSKHEIMQMLLQEKDSRIQDLTREVERLDMFAHYFKNVEVKQIEAPGATKHWWRFW